MYWDNGPVPAVIDITNEDSFTAIISVPTQSSYGNHTIRVVDNQGSEAVAIFTVTDVSGPQGPPGAPGISTDGEDGADGLNCWDLDQDGLRDQNEDVNRDGTIDVMDCRGPEGPPGLAGEGTVVAGPPGPPGENGTSGEDGLSIVWRGEWTETTEYSLNDAVSYEGGAYIALGPSLNANPAVSAAEWDTMVLQGEAGEAGEKGESGGGGSVGTTGFFLGLIALILVVADKVKKWIIP